MLSRLTVVVFMSLAIVGWLGCGHSTHAAHPAYVTVPVSNHVAGFNIDNKSGTLSAMPKSPFVTGNAPSSVTVHPSRKFAYVANAGDATLALYTIGTSSELTEVPPRMATRANPLALTIDPSGSFLFVANAPDRIASRCIRLIAAPALSARYRALRFRRLARSPLLFLPRGSFFTLPMQPQEWFPLTAFKAREP